MSNVHTNGIEDVPQQDQFQENGLEKKHDLKDEQYEVRNVDVFSAADDRDPALVPTEEDLKTLRRVPAAMPFVGFAMCLIELVERASYYGTSGPFNNFINNPIPPGGTSAGAVGKGIEHENDSPGALGLGSVSASAIVMMFKFLAYVIPIYGGIVADSQWGRFKTICWGTAIGGIAHIILVIPAIPQVLAVPKAALGVFIFSIIVLAFAAGFIKPSLGPLLCDQSPVKAQTIRYNKNGEKVIVDPQATVTRYLNIFYLCINVGALFQLATTYAARNIGFWLAFLIPGILYFLMPPVLWWASPRLVKLPPQGSVLPDMFAVFKVCMKDGGWKKFGHGGDAWWNKAKPSHIIERDGHLDASKVHWDDKFVEEIRQTFTACCVFLLIPIFSLADAGAVGLGNIVNDTSVSMTLNGVPNDLITNFNSISIIVFSPIITFFVYPFFERIGWPLKPMTRMSIGFFLGTVGAIFAAIIQHRIYKTSPCGNYATHCMIDGKTAVSPVSLWWQIPMIIFPAIGEIFVNVTSYELAYTRSPPRMKGLVYSLALFNTAIASAISLACSKALTDPNLVIAWIVLACVCFIPCFIFPTYYRSLNEYVFEWSETEQDAKVGGGFNHSHPRGRASFSDIEAYSVKDTDRY
ncbi:hypothetical protein CspHIS471_0104640 [Cutaneotrichosporon sp. HIS471]|nr:hypothetical protein CspHIS471_0104640 [Cutaneotrichosporon sp. HIS471]